jgi:NSS family neurotransmitter:Na+ symporter
VLLPVGGLAIALVGGWFMSRKAFTDEMNKGYLSEPWHGRVLLGILKFVTPVLILLILLSSLGVLKLN